MNRIKEHLLHRISKSDTPSISMRLRLLLFLLVLVFTMIMGIIVILLVSGTFSAGLSESRQLIHAEMLHTSQDVSEQYGQLSVQAVEFSKELSKSIEGKMNSFTQPFSELSNYPEQIDELVAGLYDTTFYYLQKSSCSGAFFILNATVNPDLEDSKYSKAGLYIKNMEPNIVSSSSPTITILRGSSKIGRVHSINLHTQWRMEFDIRDAGYYSKPINTAQENKSIPLSRLYYWSGPLILPGTSEEVMLCTVPLINSSSQIYGVCGLEISAMLFKLSHMPANNTYTRMFCMLSPLSGNTINVGKSMISGGYSVKEIEKETAVLKIRESSHSFNTYATDDRNIYLGYHTAAQLYPNGSPYSENSWITAVLVPKADIVDSITRLNIVLVCLLSMLVTVGIIISIIFSNKYLKPISQGIEIIKSSEPGEAPKTNVQEIDDLILYLSAYKTEVSKKAEKEKYQISMLEQFVAKTKTLTPAERSVFHQYVQGMSAKEIADNLFLSINTIKTHSKHIFAKLGVASREELLLYINMLKEIGQEIK